MYVAVLCLCNRHLKTISTVIPIVKLPKLPLYVFRSIFRGQICVWRLWGWRRVGWHTAWRRNKSPLPEPQSGHFGEAWSTNKRRFGALIYEKNLLPQKFSLRSKVIQIRGILHNIQRMQEGQERSGMFWRLRWMFEAVRQEWEWKNDAGGAHSRSICPW